MPSIIPIQIVVDGAQILKSVGEGGTADQPLKISGSLEHRVVYMITNKSYVANNQADSELKVMAFPGDMLEWRISAVGRTDFSPILVKYTSSNTNALQSPSQAVVESPFYIPAEPGDQNSPLKSVIAPDVQMTAMVQGMNTRVTYNWTFKLVDRRGQTKGYYRWDPYIYIGF